MAQGVVATFDESSLKATVDKMNKILEDFVYKAQISEKKVNAALSNIGSIHRGKSGFESQMAQMQKELSQIMDDYNNNMGNIFPQKTVQRLGHLVDQVNRISQATGKYASTVAKVTNAYRQVTTAANAYYNSYNQIQRLQIAPYYTTLQRNLRSVGRALGNYSKKLIEVNSRHKTLASTAQGLGSMLKSAFSVYAITNYINKVINLRGEFELQQKSLEALLQNKNEADKLWNQTIQLALKSPFQIKDLVKYTKQLAAYRIETDKLHDSTKMLADISSGLGVDMSRLILAYGQVKAANYLRGTELRQFSEAGINVLEMLSKYYSQLENQIVSVGEVFERVSNRMVSFADVNAVLQQSTSDGGLFYNMQEKQADTVKGMVSNLKDSIDIMLNEIGERNDEIIKNSIATIKSLLANWEGVFRYIKSMATPVIMRSLTLAVAMLIRSFGKLGVQVRVVKMHLSGAAREASRLARAVKTTTFKSFSNILTIIISVLVILITKLTESAVAAKRFKKEMSGILNQNQADAERTINEYIRLVEQLKNMTVGTKEYSNAISNINSQYSEHIGYVVQETATYEQLAQTIDKVTASIIQNAKAKSVEEGYNKIIEEQYDKQAKPLRRIKGYLQGSLGPNVFVSDEDIKSIITKFESAVREGKSKLGLSSFANIVNEYFGKDVTSKNLDKLKNEFNETFAYYNSAIVDYSETILEVLNAEQQLYKDVANLYGESYTTKEHREAMENFRTSFNTERDKKALNDFGSEYAKLLIHQQEAIDREMERRRLTIDLKYTMIGQPEEVINEKIEKKLNEYDQRLTVFKDYNKKLVKNLTEAEKDFLGAVYVKRDSVGQTSTTQFVETLNNGLGVARAKLAELKRLLNEGAVYEGGNEKLLKDIKNEELRVSTYEKALKLWGIDPTKTDEEALQNFKKRIGLIEDMRRAYVEASKYDTTPDLSSFKDAFNELFVGTGIKFSDILVASSGDVAETLNKLRPLAERIGGESGTLLMAEFEKTVAKYATESTVEGIESYLQGVKTAMDDLFEDYSAGLELAEMGFTDKNIKDLFGVETVSIETMKSVLGQMEGRLKDLGIEGTKIFEDYSNKIADLEDKEQQRRLKEYSKYLLKGQSERLKIEKDTLRQIREVNELRASGAYTDTEANDIIKGIQEERNKQIAKLDWQQFKESDIYIQMFEDLGDKSYTVLSMIKERLTKVREEMQKSGEAIDPSDMKELVSAMEQVDDAMNKKGLFKGWGKSGYLKEMAHRQEYEEQYAKAVEDSLNAETKKKEATERLATAQEHYNNAVKEAEQHEKVVSARAAWETTKISGTKEEQDAAEAIYHSEYDTYVTQNQRVKVQKTLLSSAEETVEQTTQAAETANKGLKDATTNVTKLENATKKASENFAEMAELIQGISSIMSALGSADNLFGSEYLKEDFAAIGGMIGDVATAGTAVAKVIANPADIGSWVQIITSLISLIDRIFGLGQTNIDRAIDAQYEKIAKLEKEYQKLEKSISEAYDAQDLRRYNNELQDNIELQKQAAAEAKAAAESGKDNEKNQEAAEEAQAKYDELLEESAEKAKELFSTMTNGVFDDTLSAAEGFVDAWLEAYKEVGDGMSGLTEHFEEEMMSVAKRQAALQIVGQYTNMWKEMLDEYLADNTLTASEMQDYIAEVKKSLADLNPALEQFFKDFPLTSGNELSGLQKGIQGITADQADVLAAYWNSVRFYMASVDQKFDIPLSRISVLTDDYNTNPMLQELRAISGNTSKILDALNSVVDTNGGKKAIRIK